ncbi:MAG: acyl-CoA dehydrogenase family protein [Actinomycetes bacterium]
MDFGLTEEQAELASTLCALLARRSDPRAVRSAVQQPLGFDEDLWKVLCTQVGVAALAVPEEYGGAGYSLFETHVALEELGAALTPSPLLGSGVLTAAVLLRSGDQPLCAELLPGIAEGSSIGSVAWGSGWPTSADDWTGAELRDGKLHGQVELVLDGDTADVLLVLARDGAGLSLLRVDPRQPELRRTPTPAMDQTMRFATVELDGAPAEPVATGIEAWLPEVRDVAAVAVTALQVGALQRCLDLTVAYTKEREQFGRPIGSFQALKHRMADMLVDVETSRSVSWAAAWSASVHAPDLAEKAALAKAWCSEALTRVAEEMVQLHGGIAITWEHDAHLYLKRAHALAHLFGSPTEHVGALHPHYLPSRRVGPPNAAESARRSDAYTAESARRSDAYTAESARRSGG